jgi:hypothetical protein
VWHAYLLLPLLLLLPLRWQNYAWADLTKLLLLSLRWQSYARALYRCFPCAGKSYACWRAAKLCAGYICSGYIYTAAFLALCVLAGCKAMRGLYNIMPLLCKSTKYTGEQWTKELIKFLLDAQ